MTEREDAIHRAELQRAQDLAEAVNDDMPDATETERLKEFKRRFLNGPIAMP